MKLLHLVRSVEAGLGWFGEQLRSPLLLLIRMWWGWSFAQTGWGKLMHLDRTAAFFASLGLPAPTLNALAAGTTECVGGCLLLLGLGARFVSPALIGVMVVAYATAEREAVTVLFSDPDRFTGAAPFLFLLAALLVFVFGPGRWSLDAWLQGRRSRLHHVRAGDEVVDAAAIAAKDEAHVDH